MKTSLPQLLLVEDDPVSAAYLRHAATALPAQVDTAASIAEALAHATARPHDLLLVDAHLPDGEGAHLLQALDAVGIATPALAHTATSDEGVRQELLEAGFLDVLVKPLGVAELQLALRRFLPRPSHRINEARLPDWNDAAALAALGETAHVEALRGLFLKELPGQRARVAEASTDFAAIHGELHRLAASCGFVGADRLGGAVRALLDHPHDAATMQAFLSAADALLADPAP
ncbi:MAG: response regulator [Lysobacteraceae bacterium]|nr:MAG: response regulator [Xanthomonadaceae bacterium]